MSYRNKIFFINEALSSESKSESIEKRVYLYIKKFKMVRSGANNYSHIHKMVDFFINKYGEDLYSKKDMFIEVNKAVNSLYEKGYTITDPNWGITGLIGNFDKFQEYEKDMFGRVLDKEFEGYTDEI